MKLKEIEKFSQPLDLLSFSEDKKVSDVTVEMAIRNYGSAIITKNKKIKGIYTERDLLVKVVGEGKNPKNVKVNEVMTKNVHTATLDDTVMYCLRLMEKEGFRHLPIVSEKKELISVVSQKDLLSHTISIKKIVENVYKNKPYFPAIACLIAGVLLGTSGIFIRLSETGPVSMAFFRFFLSLPILWIWMIFDNVKATEPSMPVHWKEYAMLIGGGVFLAFDLFLLYTAFNLTTIFNASLLNGLTSIFVPIFSWLVLKEKFHLYKLFTILIVLAGIWLLISGRQVTNWTNLNGDILAMASALAFSGYIIISHKLRSSFSTPTILAWTGLFCMYTLAGLLYFDSDPILPETINGWFTLFGIAFCVQIIAYALMTYSLPYLSPTVAIITIMISPVSAAMMGWIIFDEKLTYIQLFGAGVVIFGIIVLKSKFTLSRE